MEEIAKEKSIEELEKELEEAKKQQDEYLAGWQRARADFINYKKEEMEHIRGLMEYAEAEFLLKILPIVDNVERAEKTISDQGFVQIAMQLKQFLKDYEVQELKAEGEKFSPEFHEAVGEVEKEGVEPGTIVEVLQKGYTLHGKLIRPAKVTIAK